MATNLTRAAFEPSDATWQRLEELLADVAVLAESSPVPDTFFGQVLKRVVEVTAAHAGMIWLADFDGNLHTVSALNISETGLESDAARDRQHRGLVGAVVRLGRAEAFGPWGGPDDNADAVNSTPWAALLQPIRSEGRSFGAIELFYDPDLSKSASQLLLEVLASVAELCADFDRRQRLRDLASRQTDWEQLDALVRKIHSSIDLRETAYTLANDGRQFIGCDRLTVLVQRRGRLTLMAVSGVAVPDRRSNSVQLIEKLASAVVRGGTPLVYPPVGAEAAGERLPPQVDKALHGYLDAVPARFLAVLPLHEIETSPPQHPFGALVIEQFSAEQGGVCRARAEAVSGHASTALRNALHLAQIPGGRFLLGWSARAGRSSSRLRWAACALLAACAVALCLIPADFTIEARGALQPARRREVFAPNDGIVDELVVAQNASVRQGDPLLVLRNLQLELEFKRVFGEIETCQERLAALQTARIEGATSPASSPTSTARLSGEETEVKAQLNSLDRQYRLLKAQQAELTVRSPIDGQILTWNVEQLLRNRPVQRGQALLAVADATGLWTIELDVPDKRAGHVLQALRTLGPALPVTYILATDPATTCQGSTGQVALSTEPTESNEPAVRVTVEVGQEKPQQPRPGATVTAKIHCGRRALAYVWLHEAIDAIRTFFFF